MDWGSLSVDQLNQVITEGEPGIARLKAMQMAAINELRARQANIADGYWSIIDWVAARADVSHRTARSLAWTASRLIDTPDVFADLEAGEITFDRAEQVARVPEKEQADHHGFDISDLRRRVAHFRRLSPGKEKKIAASA